MKVSIGCGLDALAFEVAEGNLATIHRHAVAAALPDPAAAVRSALENPLDFPALRQALTPDDHITIVVDEHLPGLTALLLPIFEVIAKSRISPELITLLCPVGSAGQAWVDDIPEAFQDVHTEVHDPSDRNKLSYLATTKRGRRIYLNRTLVDADQAIVLSGRRYDPLTGYGGAATAIFPALGDQPTRLEGTDKLSMLPPGMTSWPMHEEAAEVCWLLGTPFFVQAIEGADNDIAHVVAGLVQTSAAGERLLNERWHVEVEAPADIVVAGIGGEPSRQGLDDLARAFACAARVVKPHGRIFLLSAADVVEDARTRLLSQASDAAEVLQFLRKHKTPDMESAFLWASAAQHASLYLLSNLPPSLAEEMFTTPLENAAQVQRNLQGEAKILFLPDAHKTMAVLKEARS